MKKIISLLAVCSLLFGQSALATTIKDRMIYEGPVTFKNSVTIDGVTYDWPAADGVAGTQLTTNGSGTLSWSAAGSGTAWDDLTSPDANKTHAFTTYTTLFTGTSTAADQWIFRGLGNFGDVSVVKIESLTGNPTDGTVLEVVSHDANVDPLVVSTSGQAGVLTVGQAGTVSIIGNTDITGTLSTTGPLYQQAIASASGGNVNLTVDAAGSGTITIGGISTGNTVFPGAVVANGNVDIGNAITDTLTITSSIDGNVTLDDGVTDSPSLILKDATDETATFKKTDGANLDLTTTATEGLRIMVGNLRVGDGSPGTAAMDGEDLYVNGASEFDGAVQIDGALTAAGAVTMSSTVEFTGASTLATLGAGEYVKIDAATTAHTDTAGALDINFDSITTGAGAVNVKVTGLTGGGGSEVISGIVIDVDDDTNAAGSVVGLDINSSDATGSSAVIGARFGTTLEQQIVANVGAANKALVIDAATVDSTQATGVIDIEWDSNTATSEAINIKATHLTGGSGQTISAIELELDADSGNAGDTLQGLYINATDTTATGFVDGVHIAGAGLRAAVQADTGYIRIGTGSTPDVTPGDDDLYVEGTIEVDGAARFDGAITANGAITGAGTAALGGFLKTVTDDTNGKTLGVAESGTVQTNAGAVGAASWDLPGAAAGLNYCFIVMAAQELRVTPAAGDVININGTAADAAEYWTANAAGEALCLIAVDATNWIATTYTGTWTQQTP